jgi:hypothetical protein
MMEFLGARGRPKVKYAARIMEQLQKSGVTWNVDTGQLTYADCTEDNLCNMWDLLRDAVTDYQVRPANSPLSLVRFYSALQDAHLLAFLVRNKFRHHLLRPSDVSRSVARPGAGLLDDSPLSSYLSSRRGATSTPGYDIGGKPLPQPSFSDSPPREDVDEEEEDEGLEEGTEEQEGEEERRRRSQGEKTHLARTLSAASTRRSCWSDGTQKEEEEEGSDPRGRGCSARLVL